MTDFEMTDFKMTRPTACFLLLALATAAGCGGSHRPFPDRDPLWKDPDRLLFSDRPEDYYSPFAWDGADQMVFRPVSRFFAVDPAGEAANVNALDEVADSSWFVNRVGRFDMTAEEVERGSCTQPLLKPVGKWTIKDAKPNGANPGFIIQAADGRRYLLKFDGTLQGERATAADVFGSRVYHAVGYHAPCNSVLFFDRDILILAEDARAEDAAGRPVPITRKDIDTVLGKSYRLPDGRYRASASLFLPGRPIGPWRYVGTRADDPNDVVPHEDRRELRGGYVLASWLNHFDTREQNTLAIWVEDEDGKAMGYVRHYYLDFGDCLGSLWEQEGISKRLGHAYYLDIPYLLEDALTLGLISRPWQFQRHGPAGPVLGYYDVERFEPDRWRPGYPNPAFGRASERDSAWMARIIARFGDEHLLAALRPARIQDPLTRREMIRILKGRRAKLLKRWFKYLSPLSLPEVRPVEGGTRLCLRDLALTASVVPADGRVYRARAWAGSRLAPVAVDVFARPDKGEVCATLPRLAGASRNSPRYLIVDLSAQTENYDTGAPARVHLYHHGEDRYRVVGLERPDASDPPG
jgi:hypothetical protein